MGNGQSEEEELMSLIHQYKDKFPETLKELGNNVIYYDPNYGKRPCEIFKDAEIFKNVTNGAFILVMNIPSLILLLKEIVKLKTDCKFDIISTGGASEEVFSVLKSYKCEFIFKRGCLFTYHPEKYKNMKNRFPLIKGVYYTSEEVLEFLRKGNNSTQILRTLKLVTLEDYTNRVKTIHKMIAKHYGKFSLRNFKREIEKVKYFINHPGEYTIRILNENGDQSNQMETMINTLELYKDIETNYVKIIRNYTSENCSVYKDFNYLLLRLNERGIEAFGYFIAGLMYSLNKYHQCTGKGESSNRELFRGMRLDISELLNYERYEGSILCFPSFTSTSTSIKAASNPDRFGGRSTDIPTRKQQGLFSVVLKIYHKFGYGAVPNGINIESISAFKSESECLFLPFSFFLVRKVNINLNNFECDIEVENYCRKFNFEAKMNDGYEINPKKDLIKF